MLPALSGRGNNMKHAVFAIIALAGSSAVAHPAHAVRGFLKSNGTYFAPHHQTNPDATTRNNFSTRGNINPYTGHAGTVNPDAARASLYAPKKPF